MSLSEARDLRPFFEKTVLPLVYPKSCLPDYVPTSSTMLHMPSVPEYALIPTPRPANIWVLPSGAKGKRSRPAFFWRLVVRQSHLAICRETIAPAFLTQAACRKTTTALATSLTATVVPCARSVCYSAPTCTLSLHSTTIGSLS